MFEEEMVILDKYDFVIDFVPYYKENASFIDKNRWVEIKQKILTGFYADNNLMVNSDFDFIKDWFGLLTFCIKRLFSSSQEMLEIVVSMKNIMDYFEGAKLMIKLDSF